LCRKCQQTSSPGRRGLAQQTWKYVQNYADAKTAVVEEIVARARAARDR
jgi:GrpB-like predicted nucleotidyltransferase (UPF0157 family)